MDELSNMLADLAENNPDMDTFELSLDAVTNAPFTSLLYQQRLNDISDEEFDAFFVHLLLALPRATCIATLLIQWSVLNILTDEEKAKLFQSIGAMPKLQECSIIGGSAFGYNQSLPLQALAPLMRKPSYLTQLLVEDGVLLTFDKGGVHKLAQVIQQEPPPLAGLPDKSSAGLKVLSLTSLKLLGGLADDLFPTGNFLDSIQKKQIPHILDPLLYALAISPTSYCNELRELQLGLSCLDPRPVRVPTVSPDALQQLLICGKQLVSVSLTNLGLMDEHCRAISEALASNTNCCCLDLSWNTRIGPLGDEHLTTLVQTNPHLMHLTIRTNVTSFVCVLPGSPRHHELEMYLYMNRCGRAVAEHETQKALSVHQSEKMPVSTAAKNKSSALLECDENCWINYLFCLAAGKNRVKQLSSARHFHSHDDDDDDNVEEEDDIVRDALYTALRKYPPQWVTCSGRIR